MAKRQRICTEEDLKIASEHKNLIHHIPETGKYINMIHPPHFSQAARILAEVTRISAIRSLFNFLSEQGESYRIISRQPQHITKCREGYRCDYDSLLNEDNHLYGQRIILNLDRYALEAYLRASFLTTEASPDSSDSDSDSDELDEPTPLSDILDALWEDFDKKKHLGDECEKKECPHSRFVITEHFGKLSHPDKDMMDGYVFELSFIAPKRDLPPIEEGFVKEQDVMKFLSFKLGDMSEMSILASLTISPEERVQICSRLFIPFSNE
jgi:hypothetical protein